MPSGITRRIERELGFTGLTDALAKLPASEFRSLLMEAFRLRADAATPAAIRAHSARDPLMQPSTADARDLLAFDRIAFQAAAEYVAADLSPVSPFGAAFTLGGMSQNNLLTTIRNAEVLGDPTIPLAIEAARRRASEDLVRLCASQRVIRLQPFDVPGYSPHFRLFALVSAGRDAGHARFEIAQLLDHARVYLRLCRMLSQAGYSLRSPLVEFADMRTVEAVLQESGVTREQVRESIRAHHLGGTERFLEEHGIGEALDEPHPLLESQAAEPLRGEFPEATIHVNQRRLEGFGYYGTFTLRISPEAPDGKRYPVIDGGFTDWTARLMENKKERLLISGIGSEFICKTYRIP